jgi:Tfp pilus assembly protein PilF
MATPDEAYSEGYKKGRKEGLASNTAEAVFGMMKDDPGGHYGAGYRDGAAGTEFRPPSARIPVRKPAAEVNPFDDKVAIKTVCPHCGALDWFEWKFLGRLTDAICGHSWYAGSGTYTLMQIRAAFAAGGKGAKYMTSGLSGGQGAWIGKGMGWFIGVLLGLGIRLEFGVLMIPIQAFAGLFQAKKTTSDMVTRLVVLVVTLGGLGIGIYKIHNALPPTMTGNSATYSPSDNAAARVLPPSGSSTPNPGIPASPAAEVQTSVPPQAAPDATDGAPNPPVATASSSDSPNLNGSAPSQQSESAPAPNQDNTPATQIVDQHSAAKEAYDYGMQFAMKNDADQALTYIERAIQLDPQFADAYVQMGVIEGYKGQCEAAIQQFNRALELNPRLARAYSNRGNCYWNFKNTDQAIRDYSASLALDSTQPEVFATRGMAYSRVGNWQQAEPDLREAIRLGSRNPSAYHNLGYTLFMQHRYPEAIQYFDQALALQPDLALALRYRGLAKQAIGQAAEGQADLQRAHTLDPKL